MVDIGGTIGSAGGKLVGGVTGTLALIGKVFPYIILGVVVGVVAWFVYEEIFLYKYQVILKRVVGKGKQIMRDKACEKRLKNGALLWKFKRLKVEKAVPPNNVWMQDSKGRIVVEGWLLNDKQIVWTEDGFSSEALDKKLEEVLEKERRLASKVKNREEITPDVELTDEDKALLVFRSNWQPVTTNDRLILADSMEQAKFGKQDLTQLLEKALPWAAFILILVVLMFGFKFYAGPLTEYSQSIMQTVAPIAENNKLTAEYLYDIKNEIQSLKSDVETMQAQNEGKVNGK